MRILAYGEDALTLWAIQKKLGEFLALLNDSSEPNKCMAFYRADSGRGGGPANFGEFDFILLADQHVYLGESKWIGSSERLVNGDLILRPEQLTRHRLMRFYIEEWTAGKYVEWGDFIDAAQSRLEELDTDKPIAPAGSLLATNLQQVLDIIANHFDGTLIVRNVLLYLHRGATLEEIPESAGEEFEVVVLNYSADLQGNYIILQK